MALARIITRSHACSRELALDLLSRGYAVEIVSPDAIPDNIADLELRVEEEPGNQLVATVEAHNGDRSASLAFLHHLKEPMPDFARRPPEAREASPLVEARGGGAKLTVGHGDEIAGASQVVIQAVIPLLETAVLAESPIATATDPPAEVPGHFAAVESNIAPKISEPVMTERWPETKITSSRRGRSAGWILRAGLTSAAVILLALLIAFGLRRNENEKTPGRNAGPASSERAATASLDAPFAVAADSGRELARDSKPVAASAIPPTLNAPANSGQAIQQIPVVAKTPAVQKARTKASRQHENDIVARDTVTYLDKRLEPRTSSISASAPANTVAAKKTQTAKHVGRRHRSPHHRGEVIAANKLTYLDKPVPKATK